MALRDRRLPALGLFVGLAILHTWPLASAPAHLARLDNDDASLNTWTIAWVAHVLPRAPLQLFEAPIFYPEHDTLAYSEHLFVPAVMGAPLLWAGLSPVLVHNLLFILGLALSGFAMYWVMVRWTGSQAAAAVAGMLYAFNAHALARFAHLQAQHVEFLPLALYAMDRVLDEGRRRDAVWLGVAFALQGLCSNYLLVFTTYAMLVAVLVRPEQWLPPSRGHVRLALAVGGVVGIGIMLPFVVPYYRVIHEQGLVRSLDNVARYSAGWADYLATGARLHYAWWSHTFFEGRTPLFPGFTAVALAIVALRSPTAWRDRRVRMTVAIGVVGFALSFGPALPGYAWMHMHVPMLSAARAAARWGRLALTAIAILAGFGVARLGARIQGRVAWATVAVLLSVMVTTEAIRTPVGFTSVVPTPAIYDRLASEPNVVLAEFPFFFGASFNRNGPYLVNNTRYFGKLVNGYSGFQPARYEARGDALQHFPEPAAMALLKEIGVTHVAVHLAGFSRIEGSDVMHQVEHSPGLELMADDGEIRLYRLR